MKALPASDAAIVQRRKLLVIAHRFYPTATTFESYIRELNAHVPGTNITLRSANDSPAYTRLLNDLFIAFPGKSTFPSTAAEGLNPHARACIRIESIMEEVITTTLRRHPKFAANNANVICNGFNFSREAGPGSIFRHLDAASPSAAVQYMRSPAFASLLSRVGHVIIRHVLCYSTLLVTITNKTKRPHPTANSASTVFLQLCGPLVTPMDARKRRRLPHSHTNIIMKRDILYRTPSHRSTTSASENDLQFHHNYNSGLPNAHFLQRLPSTISGARHVAALIFHNSGENRTLVTEYDKLSARLRHVSKQRRGTQWLRARTSLPSRLRSLYPILQTVIQRTHQHSFRRILGKACPLPSDFRPGATRGLHNVQNLLNISTPPKQIAIYLLACSRQMFPLELFGSKANQLLFETAVNRFVRTRNQKESFDVRLFFSQRALQITLIPWLHRLGKNGEKVANPDDLRFRVQHINDLLVWMFRGVLIPLLHQSFYATEGNVHRNRIYFFRREVWTSLVDPATDAILRLNGQFSILSPDQLASRTVQRERALVSLGPRFSAYPVLLYHHMRHMPKKKSLRGIQRPRAKLLLGFRNSRSNVAMRRRTGRANLRPIKIFTRARASTKSLMASISRVLQAEAQRHTSKVGAAVFSLDDIYAHFLNFKRAWQTSGKPKLYACCLDITKSFDTIPLRTLFADVVPSMFTQERYAIVKYRLSKPDIATGKVLHRFLTHVCTVPGEETSFTRLLRHGLSSCHAGGLFSDLASVTTLTRTEILAALKEFLTNNIIAVPRRSRKWSETGFAVQSQGLPQGHQMSPLLTSLFYAHVENQDMKEYLSKNGTQCLEGKRPREAHNHRQEPNPNRTAVALFLRFVDDTFFLTSEREKARQFMKRMTEGWKASHGFSINGEKTRASFKAGFGGTEGIVLMPWCGLLVDISTLELRADYSRYRTEGGRLRDFLMVEHDWNPGLCFAERSWSCFSPKLHPLLLDGQINSRAAVVLNVYQAALLTCLKFCAYTIELNPTNTNFIRNVVQTATSKFVSLVRRSVSCRKARISNCHLPLSLPEVRYLCAHAFREGINQRLRRCQTLRDVAALCLSDLDDMLKGLASGLRDTTQVSVKSAARVVSAKYCRELWEIQL